MDLGNIIAAVGVVLAIGVAAPASALGAEKTKLTLEQALEAILDKDVFGTSARGTQFQARYNSDGTTTGQATASGWTARGKWWGDGELLCRRWDTGDEQCSTLYRTGDNRYEVRTKSGQLNSEIRVKE